MLWPRCQPHISTLCLVLAAFDAIRNCSHCRRNTDDDCKAWRQARKALAVLRQEAQRIAKGVDELRDATGGCAATIYQFACGSVAYFAPNAPDFQEAGELQGDDLKKGGAHTGGAVLKQAVPHQ